MDSPPSDAGRRTSLPRDLAAAVGRMFRATRTPSRADLGRLFGEEVFGGFAGWTSGLFASWLVSQIFVPRGVRNLWGLAARDRTAVSRDTYDLLGDVSGYVVGLITLIVVHHVVSGTLRELAAIRGGADPG